MSVIAKAIVNLLEERNMTVSQLERDAGLKRTAVHNIVSGKTSNPRISTLQAISKTLNCSLYDLLDQSSQPEKISFTIDNLDLLDNCCSILIKELKAKDYQNIHFYLFYTLLKEIYFHSTINNNNIGDRKFTKWILEKTEDPLWVL